jgi:hypothetical protein
MVTVEQLNDDGNSIPTWVETLTGTTLPADGQRLVAALEAALTGAELSKDGFCHIIICTTLHHPHGQSLELPPDPFVAKRLPATNAQLLGAQHADTPLSRGQSFEFFRKGTANIQTMGVPWYGLPVV